MASKRKQDLPTLREDPDRRPEDGYIHYLGYSPRGETAVVVDQADAILVEMREQGYRLSLRQLYYQFVRRNVLANKEESYNKLKSAIARAREGALVSWFDIVDRGRNSIHFRVEEDPAEVLRNIDRHLVYDLWARQDAYVEVWVEKDALTDVVARPCREWRVPYMACKGYLSASEAWAAGQRFARKIEQGKRCVILHLGDHDPSGLHMSQDNFLRVNLYAGAVDEETYRAWDQHLSYAELPTSNGDEDLVEVQRVALNIDQVRSLDLLPNPAKEADSRSPAYVSRFGKASWELDAVEPATLEGMIRDAIVARVDMKGWNEALKEEAECEDRKLLRALSEEWNPHVVKLLRRRMAAKAKKKASKE